MSENNKHTLDRIEILTGGLLAGLVGGVGMGVVLQFGPNVFEILGALVGSPTIVAGWLVHLAVSVFFAIVFTAIVSHRSIRQSLETFIDFVAAGIAFGTVLGLLAGGVILPVAVARAGVVTLPLPFLPLPGLAAELIGAGVFAVGHLIYGLLIGATVATISGVVPSRIADRTPAHN